MISKLLNTAVEAARKAGAIIMDSFADFEISEADLKGLNDYVTEVDNASEATIIDFIRSRYPDHRFLAEESGAHSADGGVRWIIDPLDGTTNFIHHYPMFAVSIAAEENGKMLAAAVLDPVREELFTAAQGEGAFLNDNPIKVTSTSELAPSLILTGFPFKAQQYMEDFITVFRELLLATSGIRRCGSAALDLSHLACGRADGFWEFGLSPWDIAAGSLLVEEAGGRITDVELGDRYLATGNVLASNGLIHNALHEKITKHFPQNYFVEKAFEEKMD